VKNQRPTISELRENYGRAVYQTELNQRYASLIRQQIDSFAQFFTEDHPAILQTLYGADLRFMQKLQPCTAKLNQGDRALLLTLVRRFAGKPREAADSAISSQLSAISSSSPEAK
jgi:hypothetical protein